MAIRTTATAARVRLADLWQRVEDDRETVVITRRGHADVALVAADELAGAVDESPGGPPLLLPPPGPQ
jgi:antitoxin YefM